MEIALDLPPDRRTLTDADQTVVWSRVVTDTTGGALAFNGTDEVTVLSAGDYLIEAEMVLSTVGAGRYSMALEVIRGATPSQEPPGKFIQDCLGSIPNGQASQRPLPRRGIHRSPRLAHVTADSVIEPVTLALSATDKIRWRIRRIDGTGPDSTTGGTWRLTKLA